MKTTFLVQGTHCVSCKALIEDVCGEILGIKSCSVDFMTGHVEVEFDGSVDWTYLKKEIEGLGAYTVTLPAL